MDRRYNSFGAYIKKRFGSRVYKVTVDAGFTCPNRDGTVGTSGCIYCNKTGSILVQAPKKKCPHCEGDGCFYCGFTGWHRPKGKYD